MQAASEQGMDTAGTKNSAPNTIRKNSFLTWIDPYDISGSTSTEALSIARQVGSSIAYLERTTFTDFLLCRILVDFQGRGFLCTRINA
jgi:hypothetical protein